MIEPTLRSWRESVAGDWEFVRRLLIAIGVIGLAYVTFRISNILLLVFAAVLLAIILNSFAHLIRTFTRLPGGWALLAAVTVLIAAISLLGYIFGSQIAGQFHAVIEALPGAIDNLGRRLQIENATSRLQEMSDRKSVV